jgi:hypothetical protein
MPVRLSALSADKISEASKAVSISAGDAPVAAKANISVAIIAACSFAIVSRLAAIRQPALAWRRVFCASYDPMPL